MHTIIIIDTYVTHTNTESEVVESTSSSSNNLSKKFRNISVLEEVSQTVSYILNFIQIALMSNYIFINCS